jgi:hypothetical protein
METVKSILAPLLKPISPEIFAYFDDIADGALSGMEKIGLNLLPAVDVARWSKQFRSFHPLVRTMGGLVLVDGNTSNHHVYLSSGPLEGAILFLDHDGDTRVVFSSLSEFFVAGCNASSKNLHLEDLHPAYSPLESNQQPLNAFASDQLEGDDADAVIPALLHSMDLQDLDLLGRIAIDSNFLLVEAVAEAIQRHPSNHLRAIAELCAANWHAQAANAGRRALAAIEADGIKSKFSPI